jgi:alpha-mannosidase
MKNRVHLICNAHLDPVWQWRWTEGCAEALATFRNAVGMIREYPELVFNHNEAILYQWVKKYDPHLFREIRGLVEEKRWFISGGWFLQPDVNLPPYENLVRHIRYGRDFFRTEFGVEPRVAYNFDSFGHPAGLPGLLSDFGYDMYIHQRPEKEFLKLPASLYRWKGLNGSTIPAYRIEIGLYHTERKNITQRLEEATRLALGLNRDVALFWGLGDHGGGATRSDLEKIREFTAGEERVEILHGTTDGFLEAVRPLLQELPVYEGSLQRVFTGCYTSASRIKRKALEASGAAVQAGRLAEMVPESGHADDIDDIWRDILFNDFHDILPGSCTEPAEQDALDLYGRALENIRRLNMEAIATINRKAEVLKAHIPVTLFNSNPGLSTFPVEFECMSDYRPFWEGEWELRLYDGNGKEIPCQEEEPEARLPFHRWRRKISFLATDCSYGIHHFRLEAVEVPERRALSAIPATGRDLPASGLGFLVVKDDADSWGTGCDAWREVIGTFSPVTDEQAIENGPVRTLFESVLEYGRSRIIVHRIHYPDWPVSEYRIRIQWNEERRRLKLAIPAPAENCRLTARIPGGSEEFPADGQEYVHGSWLSLKEPPQGDPSRTRRQGNLTAAYPGSLFIAHNGLHGFDFDGREIRLSVLRSAAYCHERGYNLDNGRTHKYMDQGIHDIRLAIWRTDGDPEALAEWLLTPPLVWPHLPIG